MTHVHAVNAAPQAATTEDLDPTDEEVLQPDMLPARGNTGRKQQTQVGQGLQRDPEEEDGDDEEGPSPAGDEE